MDGNRDKAGVLQACPQWQTVTGIFHIHFYHCVRTPCLYGKSCSTGVGLEASRRMGRVANDVAGSGYFDGRNQKPWRDRKCI